MLIFSMKSRAFVESSIRTFGSAHQISIWENWSQNNPQIRVPDGPLDDRKGPVPTDLRDVIVDCLHERYNHLMDRLKRPGITEDEAADIGNDASIVYGIASSINELKLNWF